MQRIEDILEKRFIHCKHLATATGDIRPRKGSKEGKNGPTPRQTVAAKTSPSEKLKK